jgi:hypothetical protein
MSTLAISHPSQSDVVQTYWKNVGQALVALVAAVFAAKPAATSIAEASTADASATPSLYRLYSLASRFDSVSPSLAQELRFMARG